MAAEGPVERTLSQGPLSMASSGSLQDVNTRTGRRLSCPGKCQVARAPSGCVCGERGATARLPLCISMPGIFRHEMKKPCKHAHSRVTVAHTADSSLPDPWGLLRTSLFYVAVVSSPDTCRQPLPSGESHLRGPCRRAAD